MLSAWIELPPFTAERQKILITWKLLSPALGRTTHHEWAFVDMVPTPESHTSPSNKSKMAAADILNFGKMSTTPYWIKISAPNLVGWCVTVMRRRSHDESRNRKLIRVTSSNERLEHKCVDSVTIIDVWTQSGTESSSSAKLSTLGNVPNSYDVKIQNGGGCHLEFRENVNNFGLDKSTCTKFGRMMRHGHAKMTTWVVRMSCSP